MGSHLYLSIHFVDLSLFWLLTLHLHSHLQAEVHTATERDSPIFILHPSLYLVLAVGVVQTCSLMEQELIRLKTNRTLELAQGRGMAGEHASRPLSAEIWARILLK